MRSGFSWRQRGRSFKHAIRGLGLLLRSQHNAWIHVGLTVLVLMAGWYVALSPGEWCWIASAIVAVWVAEGFNTAIEFLADAVTEEAHPLVRNAKDVAAGAVLIAAMGAAAIGLLVFGPRLAKLLTGHFE